MRSVPDHEQRQGGQLPRQVRDDLQAQLVAPVQVLERKERRSLLGQRREACHRVQDHEAPSAGARRRSGGAPVTSMRSVSSALPAGRHVGTRPTGPSRARGPGAGPPRARRPGARPPRTTARSPAQPACSCTARSSRVLPMPASPARSSSPPRPSVASPSGRRARARSSSLPCIAPGARRPPSSVPPTSVPGISRLVGQTTDDRRSRAPGVCSASNRSKEPLMARYIDRNPVPTGLTRRQRPHTTQPARRRDRRRPVRRRGHRPPAGPGRARRGHGRPVPPGPRHPLDALAVPRRRRTARPVGPARRRGRHRHPRDPVRRLPPEGETVRQAVKDRAGVDFVLAPRRYVLDALLADAAVAAGARLVTDTTVTGVLRDAGGRVIGVTARDADGTPRSCSRGCVVGADGAPLVGGHGTSARRSSSGTTPRGACFYTYVGGVDWGGFEFHVGGRRLRRGLPDPRRRGLRLADPAADRLAPVRARGPTGRRRLARRAGRGRARRWPQRCAQGRIAAPVRGCVDLPNHVRRAARPGLGAGRRRRLPPRPDHRARDDRRVPRRRTARRRARRGPARDGSRGRAMAALRAAARRRAAPRPSR